MFKRKTVLMGTRTREQSCLPRMLSASQNSQYSRSLTSSLNNNSCFSGFSLSLLFCIHEMSVILVQGGMMVNVACQLGWLLRGLRGPKSRLAGLLGGSQDCELVIYIWCPWVFPHWFFVFSLFSRCHEQSSFPLSSLCPIMQEL